MEKIIKHNLRSLEEFQRVEVILKRCRNCLDSIDIALRAASQDATPIGNDSAYAITQTASELAVSLSKIDAYMRLEKETQYLANIKAAAQEFMRAYYQASDNNNWGSLGETEDKLHQLLIENGDKS